MIVAICVLAGLLIISVLALIFVFNTLQLVVGKNFTENMSLEEMFDIVFQEKNLEEKYEDVILFVSVMYESEFEGMAYDFSEYETKNIISLIAMTKEKMPTEEEEEDNHIILSHQNVYKLKGGGFQWDYRKLL